MHEHIAFVLVSVVIDVMADEPQIIPPSFDTRTKKMLHENDLLCGSNPWGIYGAGPTYLGRREERKPKKPQPKKIAWENRLKCNGCIVNLIPVVDGFGRAQCVVPMASAVASINQEHVVCTQRGIK